MPYLSITRIWIVFLSCLLILPLPVKASSIIDIPEGTVFQLKRELEIPANRNFSLVGRSALDEAFNGVGQTLNDQTGRWPGVYTYGGYESYGTVVPGEGYLAFETYYSRVFESFEETYLKCLNRHRRYFSVPGEPTTPVIIQNGRNNTAIINQNGRDSRETYSYIGQNYCSPPEHTLAALVIDRDEAEGGGFFAKDYKFTVTDVRVKTVGYYYLVKILFDHDVLNGLMIVTTHDPRTIPIGALKDRSSGGGQGFFASIGKALGDVTAIGGNYFRIELPGKRYYK